MWSALADPHRRAMLDVLREGGCAVGELATRVGLTQPATSKHLRVLREAGLVLVRKDAQQRIYTVSPARMAELDAWLAPYRKLWAGRLDALGRQLDAGRPMDAGPQSDGGTRSDGGTPLNTGRQRDEGGI